MSKNRVPEEQREAQLRELHRITARARKPLKRLRGQLQRPVSEIVLECLEGAKSASEAQRNWQKYATHVDMMIRQLARLEAQNMSLARDELWRTLTERDYTYIGEELVTDTVPYTVFMIDPTIAISIATLAREWTTVCQGTELSDIRYHHRAMQVVKAVQHNINLLAKTYNLDATFCELIREVVGEIDEFRLDTWSDWYFGGFKQVHRSIFGTIINLANKRRLQVTTKRTKGQQAHNFCVHHDDIPDLETVRGSVTGVMHEFPATALAFGRVLEQEVLLSAFQREDQDRVASWHFKLPADVLGRGYKKFYIAFYNEAERDLLRRHWPDYISFGVQAGLCAMVIRPAYLEFVTELVKPRFLLKRI